MKMQYSYDPVTDLQELTRGCIHRSESHYQDRTEKENIAKHSYLVQFYVRIWDYLGCANLRAIRVLPRKKFRVGRRFTLSFLFGTRMLDPSSTFIFLPSVSIMLMTNAFLLRVAWA